MYLSVPNIISLARVIMAPIVYILLSAQGSLTSKIAVIIFIIGALTDYFDGWIARRYKQQTEFGIFFDPLADKILTASAFFAFVTMGILPLWMVLIVIFRDVFTTFLRLFADEIRLSIKTSRSAKVKTFIQMVFIIYLLILLFISTTEIPGHIRAQATQLLYGNYTDWAMSLLTAYTVWTSIEYIFANREVIRRLLTKEGHDYSAILLGSFFGIGFLPKAPGTFGSLAALLLALFSPPWYVYALSAGIAILIGFWAIPSMEKRIGDDSPSIVIDEVAGMWLTFALPSVTVGWVWALVGFGLFRLFDIWKPYPIRLLNEQMGALWVIADDIIAGLYAGFCLFSLYWTYNIFYLVYLGMK